MRSISDERRQRGCIIYIDSSALTNNPSHARFAPFPQPPNPYSLDSLYPSKYGYSPHAFNGTTPYLPPTTSPYNVSGKLLSPPYHAVVALENFFLSPQGTGDVGKLVEVFPELYKAQAHIMGKVREKGAGQKGRRFTKDTH